MASTLDTKKFSDMIKSKRANVGLRTIASDIGVSPSTLSRIEQGNLPDIETYIKLCDWLDVSTDFFTNQSIDETDVQENVIAHLRADQSLPDETSNALIEMINLAYASYNKEKKPKERV